MPELTITIATMLFSAGVLAGICNAVAGGGTFFTFPVFIASGLPPVVANASNAVAVWPGSAIAALSYRRELVAIEYSLKGSVLVALAGGITGALLLAVIGDEVFSRLVPLLILFASLLFLFGRRVNAWLDRYDAGRGIHEPSVISRLMEFVFAVYGGFFGAGLGLMLMASLLMLGVHDLQVNNALKNMLSTVITSVALLVFFISGLVSWPHTVVALAGAGIGGLLGGRVAKLLPAHVLRSIVITVGFGLTAFYSYKYYLVAGLA